MTSRLIIDDLKEFTKLGDDGVTYARTVCVGLIEVMSYIWDEIWLDFDMGNNITTKPIFNYMEEAAIQCGLLYAHKVVVCSMNPEGRKQIHAALDRHYDVIDIKVNDYL